MKKQLLLSFTILMAISSIAQTWTKTSTFKNPVNAHTLTTLANGDVLQVAGDSGFQTYLNDVYLYSVINDTWTEVANYPTNIENHIAFSISDTEVIVIGGSIEGSSTDQVYAYNTETDAWTAKAALPAALESLSAVQLADGRIFVTGGWNLPLYEPNAETFIYDAKNDSWTTLASMPQGLTNTACVLLGNGDIIVAGGLNPSFSTVADSYVYNFEKDSWTKVGAIPYALSGGSMATSLSNGSAALVGGFDFLTGSFKDKVLVYDTKEQVWNELLTLDIEIANGIVAEINNGKILITAGNNGAQASANNKMSIVALNGLFQKPNKESLKAAYIVDFETGKITTEDNLPEPRQASKHTVLKDGRILITGGAGIDLSDNSYNDGIIYEKSINFIEVNITFKVVDENDLAVELATIVFNNETLTTDINGSAVFTAVSGTTLGYTVLMENYDTVMVSETDEEAINVGKVDIEKTIKLKATVGIENITNNTLSVNIFPTISNGNITVENKNEYALTLKVFNQQGQLVRTINSIKGYQNISLDVNKGMYIIVTEINNSITHTQKIIVQ